MQATRTCSVDGCDRRIVVCTPAQLCDAHYRRWRKTGSVGTAPIKTGRPPCAVPGCERKHRSSGYCIMHYQRWYKHGDPNHVDHGGWIAGSPAESHPRWKGGSAGYTAAHRRAAARHGPVRGHACLHCGERAAHWAYDKADPQDLVDRRGCRYSLKPDHYIPLCVSCHWRFDGAGQRLHGGGA